MIALVAVIYRYGRQIACHHILQSNISVYMGLEIGIICIVFDIVNLYFISHYCRKYHSSKIFHPENLHNVPGMECVSLESKRQMMVQADDTITKGRWPVGKNGNTESG